MNVLKRHELLIASISAWTVTLVVLIKAWNRLRWLPLDLMITGAVLFTVSCWILRKSPPEQRRLVTGLLVMQIFLVIVAGWK